ncbi:MAG: beta strand repeat-containing protein, partial [Bacteroidota bacterium]
EQNGIPFINSVIVTGALVGNGSYATLGTAFTAINGGTQTGANITVTITKNTDELSSSASLNAGTWASLTIIPDGPRIITGATTAGSALINFNGADNVTINGLNTDVNSLSIINTTVSATAGTSTIRFINDASNNTITNCTLSGSSNLATSGTVFFSTGPTTGNDGNTISNCAITPAGTNLPVNAIYSAGTSVAIDNSSNTIHNNSIRDYFSPTLSTSGIFLASNSAAWTITNNKLFQTATRTSTTNSRTIRGIGVITASAGGYTIHNNSIGFASDTGTGTTIYDGAFTTAYRGIDLTANTTTSSIQGNTIAGINFTTSLVTGATSGLGAFSGIAVSSGTVNMGTTEANIIGSNSSPIIVNNTTATAVRINGIYVASASATATIQNNVISGFSTSSAATSSYSFIGISTAGALGNFTIRQNTIGSTTLANSITMGDINTTTGVCSIIGINCAATGTIEMDSNTIANNTVFGSGGTTLGINNSGAAVSLSMSSNTIRNFTITNSTATVRVIQNSGIITSFITLNNNKLGDANGDLITFTVANSGHFLGIYNANGSTACNVSIQNNDIRGVVYAVASSGLNSYILNNAATLTQTISGNTFTNLSVNTSGNIIFIQNGVSLPANGTQTISNNSIVTGFNNSGTSGVVTLCTSGNNSDSTATIINSGNNFSNITIAGSTSVNGWSNVDIGKCTKTISNNIFRNWTVGSGFTTVLDVTDYGINKTSVFNNTIENIDALAGIYGISLRAYGVLNCYDNTIVHLACSSSTTSVRLEGIRFQTFDVSTSNLPNKIYNNTISNLFNAGGIGDNRTLGIGNVGDVNAKAISIYSNTISNISSNGSGNHQLYGLYLNDCVNGNAYKNKIYNIASNGVGSPTVPTVIGISVSNLFADNVWNIYNNLVNDLKAPNTSSTENAVVGIYLGDADTTFVKGLCNLYYNTIHLYASSTGTDFGTAGVYHGNTGTLLDMRNNIISNSSAPSGAGKTVALLHSALGASYNTIYLSSSNNNLFYAGTPGVNNLLFSNSVNNAQTLTNLQTILTPRDSNSKSGVVTFISTNGSDVDFLRPDTTNAVTTSLLNDNGTNLTSVTDDYTNRARALIPDIGAYEFNTNHFVWLGGDNNWSNPANWNFSSVPDGTMDIAVLNGTILLDEDLTIQPGKAFVIDGTGAMVIAPGKTLTISGSANFGGKPVTLKSDSTGTASIGQITGTLSDATNVTVERYIPGITSPAT